MTQPGPIQTAWIQRLKDNPHLQLRGGGFLGAMVGDEMHYCCLGLGKVVLCELNDTSPELVRRSSVRLHLADGLDVSMRPEINYLAESYLELGLYDKRGTSKNVSSFITYNSDLYYTLASANDAGVPWSIIAEHLENHPEHFFATSV